MGTPRLTTVLPPLRTGVAAPAVLTERRAAAERRPSDAGPGVTVDSPRPGGVPCIRVTVDEPKATIVYLHGGGFRMGSAAGWRAVGGRLARAVQAEVILPDYRLAPEHPFPAGLYDAAAVCDALSGTDDGRDARAAIGDGSPRPVLLAGDSAGGGLALALALAARRTAAFRPAGIVLLSAWLDLRCRSSTLVTRAETDHLFPPSSAREAADQYLQGFPDDDPLVSPLLGVGPGLPPVLAFASSDEILLDDSVELARQLAHAGSAVTLEVVRGVPHAWPAVLPDAPESDVAIRRIGQFVGDLLATDRAT
jgi:monoterpene epsilon-lactone hydrolase